MKKCVSLVLIFVIILSGCTRITELDEKSFVTAIGLDKGENYKLRFTFIFTTPAKGGTSSDPKEKDETIVIEAPSLYSAIEQINNFKSKTIVLTHTQTIIFSEELAREGLSEYIYMMVRSSHFRPNTYICIADKSSMEFLENVNPSQTYHLEKYFQLIFDKMTSGKKGDIYMYDSYFRLLSEGKASVLPYCSLSHVKLKDSVEEEASEKESDTESESESEINGEFAENTDDFSINTVAGYILSESDNKAEIQGIAVLKEGRVISILGRRDAMMLQLVTNSFPNSYITLSNPKFPDKMITAYIRQSKNTTIKVKCEEVPKIQLEIDLEGDFTEVGQDSGYIKNPDAFEDYFREKTTESLQAFLTKITNDLESDVCGFSDVAKAQFLTVQDWENYNWEEKFKDAQYNIKINIVMRTYGELSQYAGDK